ncbi:hypothetical protein VNO80_02593 [Phaseolus coccineus]|uniref:Uncharacterized protein n=1 Tax=Phaseolus coccineus TaxID=3886 RepID=A0AAN9NUI4_PHACN
MLWFCPGRCSSGAVTGHHHLRPTWLNLVLMRVIAIEQFSFIELQKLGLVVIGYEKKSALACWYGAERLLLFLMCGAEQLVVLCRASCGHWIREL